MLPRRYSVYVSRYQDLQKERLDIINKHMRTDFISTHTWLNVTDDNAKITSVCKNPNRTYSFGYFAAIVEQDYKKLNFFNALQNKFVIMIAPSEVRKMNELIKNVFYYASSNDDQIARIMHYDGNRIYRIQAKSIPKGATVYSGHQLLNMWKNAAFETLDVKIQPRAETIIHPDVKQSKFFENSSTIVHTAVGPSGIAQIPGSITHTPKLNITPVVQDALDAFKPKKNDIVLTRDGDKVLFLGHTDVNCFNNIMICDIKYKNALANDNKIDIRLVDQVLPYKVKISMSEIAELLDCSVDQLEIV